MRRKGFTLIELIVVIAIIAILAAIIAPNAFKAVEKAKISGTIEDFRSIKTGAMAFYSDVGTWPNTCANSTACADTAGFVSNSNASLTGWDGPYLEKWPQTSKWGGLYQWTNNAATATFGPGNTGERYVTVTAVPLTAAVKVKAQVDGSGGNLTTGQVHYSNTSTTSMDMIVSRDGPIN